MSYGLQKNSRDVSDQLPNVLRAQKNYQNSASPSSANRGFRDLMVDLLRFVHSSSAHTHAHTPCLSLSLYADIDILNQESWYRT